MKMLTYPGHPPLVQLFRSLKLEQTWIDFCAHWASLFVVYAVHGSGYFCDDSFKRCYDTDVE